MTTTGDDCGGHIEENDDAKCEINFQHFIGGEYSLFEVKLAQFSKYYPQP